MISSFDIMLLVIYIITVIAVAMTILYLVFKGMTFLLDKLMELLLSKTTFDIEECALVVAVIGTVILGIFIFLLVILTNNVLL